MRRGLRVVRQHKPSVLFVPGRHVWSCWAERPLHPLPDGLLYEHRRHHNRPELHDLRRWLRGRSCLYRREHEPDVRKLHRAELCERDQLGDRLGHVVEHAVRVILADRDPDGEPLSLKHQDGLGLGYGLVHGQLDALGFGDCDCDCDCDLNPDRGMRGRAVLLRGRVCVCILQRRPLLDRRHQLQCLRRGLRVI